MFNACTVHIMRNRHSICLSVLTAIVLLCLFPAAGFADTIRASNDPVGKFTGSPSWATNGPVDKFADASGATNESAESITDTPGATNEPVGKTTGASGSKDQPATQDEAGAAKKSGPFDRGTMNIQAQGAFYQEAWGHNGNQETLAGSSVTFGYYFLKNLSINVEVELLGVWQDSLDTFLGGFSVIPRWNYFCKGRFSLFIDAGLGLSLATKRLPEPNGTNFNFMILASPGFTVQLTDRCILMVCFRYMHLSNASLWGNQRNPDIDALGGQAGVMFPF